MRPVLFVSSWVTRIYLYVFGYRCMMQLIKVKGMFNMACFFFIIIFYSLLAAWLLDSLWTWAHEAKTQRRLY
ncbi:hypothetical protein BX666DRAFT_1990192 [Dichotomocladium elegans]|nr:hypothetical protein BX666DRAFT_1990192 [Dichotomocladium elegans]